MEVEKKMTKIPLITNYASSKLGRKKYFNVIYFSKIN